MSSIKKTLNILVVEDNQADTEMIRIYLEESKMRHELFSAESLMKAFLQLKEHTIDLVLLDFGLPDSNGLNTLNAYLENFATIPVIVMTGLKDQRKGTESVRAGAQDYLVKGEFNSEQLVKVIRYSLERFRINEQARKKAELSDSENDKLQTLHQMTLISTWEMDIVTNAMKWSPELFQTFQLRPNQFPPSLSDYLNYVHREDKEAVEAFFTEAIKFEENGPIEHRITIENRVVKHISLRTRIKFDEKTNKVLLLGSVQDITRYGKNTDKEPIDKNTVQQKNKINTNDFINQISFNIRTPLSTLVHLIYLLEKTALNRQQKKLLLDLKTTIDDLSFTLSNLVNLSILSNKNSPLASEHFRPIDLLESIERVMVFKAQQNNREIDMYIDSRLAINVQGDSDKLGQLFFCMMELAFMHSNEGSFVKVRCTNGGEENDEKKSDGLLIVQLEYSGLLPEWPFEEDNIETRAEDVLDLIRPQGVSQSRERLLAVVFLRLCKQLEIKHQTNISNNGVFMDLEIPLKTGRKISDNIPDFPQKDVSILLVEDHPMHQIATKQILTTWSDKVRVTIASNGKVALAKMKEKSFNIVLMDLQMPVMDGMTATAQIRQSSPVPIIALTASTSIKEEERCYQVGMNEYLAKPFQPQDLYRKIMLLIHDDDE